MSTEPTPTARETAEKNDITIPIVGWLDSQFKAAIQTRGGNEGLAITTTYSSAFVEVNGEKFVPESALTRSEEEKSALKRLRNDHVALLNEIGYLLGADKSKNAREEIISQLSTLTARLKEAEEENAELKTLYQSERAQGFYHFTKHGECSAALSICYDVLQGADSRVRSEETEYIIEGHQMYKAINACRTFLSASTPVEKKA